MLPFQIRRLTEADADAMWNIRATALESEPLAFAESVEEHRLTTVEGFAQRLAGSGLENFTLGAFRDGELIGMAGFYREQRIKRRHQGGIWGVFVRAQHRGQGIARALITAILETVRPLDGLTHIHLSVSANQHSARRLYAALGFRTYGVEPDGLRYQGVSADQEHMVYTATYRSDQEIKRELR